MSSLALFSMPHGTELLIIAIIALLIFGRRLPDLGRSLGRGIVEFKKGLKGMKDEMEDVSREVDEAERRAELEADEAIRSDVDAMKQKVAEKSAAGSDRPDHP
jgi:sec-independent protein translocase protein TatA